MATLVPTTHPAELRPYSLVEGLNRVGRAPGNELRLEEASISALHCELWLMKEQLLVRDLNSTNGTFVNGRPVAECILSEGDILAVGSLEFVVRDVPGGVEIKIPSAAAPPQRPLFTPDGDPCCSRHPMEQARFRCPRCGEQFCRDCVRLLARRGGEPHAFCPTCDAECVPVVVPRRSPDAGFEGSQGWLSKLTKTLRLRP